MESIKRDTPWHSLPTGFREIVSTNHGALLLETARQDRQNDKSFLFLNPLQELIAWTADELENLLHEVDSHTAEGCFVAGYFTYECGEQFVGVSPNLSESEASVRPLAWLGVYRNSIQFDHHTGIIHGSLPTPQAKKAASPLEPLLKVDGLQIAEQDYAAKIDRIQAYLAAGDTYQVNFTDRVRGSIQAAPLEIYSTLIEQQPVSFAAYVNRSGGPILSFSPELFYRTSQGEITVRPMKGTWARGTNLETDREAQKQLRNDEKNRGEHITIVDLLRNDVGKVCELGTVHVKELLAIERYTTLLQMTSTISGRLFPRITPSAIFRQLFPSGSITGAPKRRTMEIIRELESKPRGIYTGSIGYFGPEGESCFNVAIRTMDIHSDRFSLGVGGGITADSIAADEFKECQLKAAFLTKRDRPFSLIETTKCSQGIALLPGHLQRLVDSAAYFEIAYDQDKLRTDIEVAIRSSENRETKIRIELHLNGTWDITTSPLLESPWHGRVLLIKEQTVSDNIFLHHKTTNRRFYDEHLAKAIKAGFDEVLFLNERSEISEGAISNIFLEKNGSWITPSLRSGVLPGVQRAAILAENPDAFEASIGLADLRDATAIWMCNALRGIRPLELIQSEDGTIVWTKNSPKL